MVSLNGLGFANSIYQPETKNVQRVNNIATGVDAAGIIGTAVAAGAITRYAQTQGSLLNRVATASAGFVSKVAEPLKAKITPILANLTDKVVNNKAFRSLAITGALVADKVIPVLNSVKNHMVNLPKPVKIIAGAALVGLAISHVYRSGQISGINLANQKES